MMQEHMRLEQAKQRLMLDHQLDNIARGILDCLMRICSIFPELDVVLSLLKFGDAMIKPFPRGIADTAAAWVDPNIRDIYSPANAPGVTGAMTKKIMSYLGTVARQSLISFTTNVTVGPFVQQVNTEVIHEDIVKFLTNVDNQPPDIQEQVTILVTTMMGLLTNYVRLNPAGNLPLVALQAGDDVFKSLHRYMPHTFDSGKLVRHMMTSMNGVDIQKMLGVQPQEQQQQPDKDVIGI